MKTCPHCDCDISEPKEGKQRSTPQLRRYFKTIRLAYDQWPEDHQMQFASAEELRKFLQVKAGYGEVTAIIPLTGIRKEQAQMLATAAIHGAKAYAFPIIRGSELRIVVPKSIRYDKLSHSAFCELNDRVAVEIELALGITCDQLLEQGVGA